MNEPMNHQPMSARESHPANPQMSNPTAKAANQMMHQGAVMNEGRPGHMTHKMSLADLPKGKVSPSGKYWCLMCKKFFQIDEPVCPYMPSMCINTPLAVETLPPGSTIGYERIGLFYPKLVQRLQATVLPGITDVSTLGQELANNYLSDLQEWRVRFLDNPYEALKSFIIFFVGADVATRNTENGIVFYLVDASIIWGKEMESKKKLKAVLLSAINSLKGPLGLADNFDLHFMDMYVEELGRFFCGKCNMFFEFGGPQEIVTCPFMPQKCKFKPHSLKGEAQLDLGLLTKIYRITPKLFQKNMATLLKLAGPDFDTTELEQTLEKELNRWSLSREPEKLQQLKELIGLI